MIDIQDKCIYNTSGANGNTHINFSDFLVISQTLSTIHLVEFGTLPGTRRATSVEKSQENFLLRKVVKSYVVRGYSPRSYGYSLLNDVFTGSQFICETLYLAPRLPENEPVGSFLIIRPKLDFLSNLGFYLLK